MAAKTKKFKRIGNIKDLEGSGFGEYSEANGGGSPKGGAWGGQSGRIGWKKRVENGEVKGNEHRVEQPRTADGKFTYNSVNGKETKYDGRGETVNPLLTGGENGVKISEVKKQFEAKSGNIYDKYKDKWYQKGSEKIVQQGKKLSVAISNEDIWEIARRSWNIKKGMFGKEEGVFGEIKRGAPGKQEKIAKQAAGKANAEQYVMSDEGGIYKRGEGKDKGPKPFKKKGKDTGDLKHSPAQIKAVRDQMRASGFDDSVFTDEQIDQLYDRFFK